MNTRREGRRRANFGGKRGKSADFTPKDRPGITHPLSVFSKKLLPRHTEFP